MVSFDFGKTLASYIAFFCGIFFFFIRQEVIQPCGTRQIDVEAKKSSFICEWKCFISPLDGHRNHRNHKLQLSLSDYNQQDSFT